MAAILLVCAGRLAALPQLSGPGAPAGGDPEAGRTQVRFAFCKRKEVLQDALARLEKWARRP